VEAGPPAQIAAAEAGGVDGDGAQVQLGVRVQHACRPGDPVERQRRLAPVRQDRGQGRPIQRRRRRRRRRVGGAVAAEGGQRRAGGVVAAGSGRGRVVEERTEVASGEARQAIGDAEGLEAAPQPVIRAENAAGARSLRRRAPRRHWR
jgi:hypothetical protein